MLEADDDNVWPRIHIEKEKTNAMGLAYMTSEQEGEGGQAVTIGYCDYLGTIHKV